MLPRVILQLKIRLQGISPMIWRRVLVPESVSLRELHGVVPPARYVYDMFCEWDTGAACFPPGPARHEHEPHGIRGSEREFAATGRCSTAVLGPVVNKILFAMVAKGGIEPPTRGFSVRCSTD